MSQADRESAIQKVFKSAVDFSHSAEFGITKTVFTAAMAEARSAPMHELIRSIGANGLMLEGEVTSDSASVKLSVHW
jgi:hypothetical protein